LATQNNLMTQQDREFIKTNHKWPFVWTDIFGRYFILITPLFFIFLSFLISHFSASGNSNDYLLIAIPIFLFGAFLFYIFLNRLESERKFRVIPFKIKEDISLKTRIDKLGWIFSSEKDDVITANTKISLFSWGEVITIIAESDQLLFNSRPGGRQPFTFNRDR
jgi:hypothetical protein